MGSFRIHRIIAECVNPCPVVIVRHFFIHPVAIIILGAVNHTALPFVAENAGDGYDVYIGTNRANVSVVTATDEAAADNLDHNTLEKAIR